MGSASLSQTMLHCICTALILLVWKGSGVSSEAEGPYKLVCYYASWATYREGDGKFSARDIDPHLCTHIISTSAGVNSDGEIFILDTDLSLETGRDDFRKLFDLWNHNNQLELMIGIGGHGDKSKEFPRVVATPESRKTFIDSVIKFLDQYGFTGINIDWMYPGIDHTENYVALLRELREELHQYMTLSIVGYAITTAGYDVKEISKYVDFVNLWSFDFHGPWRNTTGYNAALYRSELYSGLNVDSSVRNWLNKGMDPRKLIVGIPTFGRSYTLQNESRFLPYSEASIGDPGPFTKEPGLLGYNELVEYINRQSGMVWFFLFDEVAKAHFAWCGYQLISYDGVSSFESKAEYIKEKGLGGAMVYSLDTDNFHGVGGASKKFHLISTIKEGLSQNRRRIPIKCTAIGQLIRDPEDCGQFFSCTEKADGSFGKVLNNCSDGLGFHEIIQRCDYKINVPGCPENVCYKPGQLVKYPTDCIHFFSCTEKADGSKGQVLQKCSHGLGFNEASQQCDYPVNILGCRVEPFLRARAKLARN